MYCMHFFIQDSNHTAHGMIVKRSAQNWCCSITLTQEPWNNESDSLEVIIPPAGLSRCLDSQGLLTSRPPAHPRQTLNMTLLSQGQSMPAFTQYDVWDAHISGWWRQVLKGEQQKGLGKYLQKMGVLAIQLLFKFWLISYMHIHLKQQSHSDRDWYQQLSSFFITVNMLNLSKQYFVCHHIQIAAGSLPSP